MINDENELINKSMDLLKNFPLCDRCLGRFFAKLGLGWSNYDRGKAIKMMIIMYIHEQLRKNLIKKEEIKDILINIGPISNQIYKSIFSDEPKYKKCYICNDILDNFINDSSNLIINDMEKNKATTFLVGIKVSDDTIIKEENLKSNYKLSYGESIKNELKREIGKKIQLIKPEFKVDFETPQIVYEVSYPDLKIRDQITSLIVFGRYKKTIRGFNIIRYDKYSFIDAIKAYDSEDIKIHLINRDEKQFRTIGKGAYLIAEIKRSKLRKNVDRIIITDNVFIDVDRIELKKGQINKLVREKRANRIYRALILCERKVNNEDINKLESIRNLTVEQVINRKVLRGILRYIKCYKIEDNLIECLISIDEPIYIKELIDRERSNPNISSILGNDCSLLEGDLLSSE